MNVLPSFDRNDLVRATALIAVVAFPLFAYAGLGLGAAATQPKDAVAAAVATEPAPVGAAGTVATPCAEQHWPFFSQDCLRGSTQQPRLVSLTADAPPAITAAVPEAKPAKLAEAASGKAVKPKKHPKPHVASRSPERRSPPAYAAAPAPAPVLMAGW